MSRCVLSCLVAALLVGGAGSTLLAQNLAELRWDHRLEHYPRAEASAYDAWTITPPAHGSENPQEFGTIVEAIGHEANTSIAHIFLGDLVRQPELQKAVIEYVTAQPEFQKHAPPTGFGRWEFKNSDKLRALVAEGLMKSPFVADCNAALAKQGKAVKSVSMEKLFFTKKDGQWGWDAIVWLLVDPAPK
ncbi:MAG: hypothetical protein P4L99_18320 [Chthoniobacter sp.]|nr:hypothetical protein [Chthoniobacter sp.]